MSEEDLIIKNEKNEKKIKKGISKKNIFIVLLVLLIIMVYLFLNHKLFNISYIDYQNDGFVKEDAILLALDPDETHSNIFLFNTKEAENRLSKIQNISGIKVKKVFPDTIQIIADENFEIGYVKKVSGKKYINQDGKIMDENPTGNNGGFDYEISMYSTSLTKEEVLLVRDIMNYDFGEKVKKINFAKDGTIDIIYKDITIHFEALENAQEGLSELENIISNIEKEDIDASAIYMYKNKQPIIVRESNGN